MINKTVFLFITLLVGVVCSATAQHLNQAGYKASSVKRVFLPEEYQNKEFSITNNKGKIVLSGKTSKSKYWKQSGTSVCAADFTSLKTNGNYTFAVHGLTTPVCIKVDNNCYEKLGYDVFRMFYQARASMPITKEFAGKYARAAGHPDKKVFIHASAATEERPEGYIISSPGGWYDAGDYNKYVVNSGISTYTMLHAVAQFPKYLSKIDFNIPESSSKATEVLHEALYNLRWMLSMQDPYDGGVYHKLTSKTFCDVMQPSQDLSERYVVMKTTSAALDFAATMAKAYRVLKGNDKVFPELADSCLKAAEYAWQWSVENTEQYYQQPEDIRTGRYPDTDLSDEQFWAATELYLSTGKQEYQNKIDFNNTAFVIPQWRIVSTLALYSIIRSSSSNEDLKEKAKAHLLNLANQYLENYNNSPYRVSIAEFPWGSNGDVSNQGMMFLETYRCTGDKKYLEAADACLGYILGANPTGYCFVTGYGHKSPKDIHERRSQSDGIAEPIPGFLVGGPTMAAQKDCGKEAYTTEFPACAYLDSECSYSTNEITINWNSPLAFLVFGLDKYLSK